jgi:16S rRNA (uracil1498-N3)-methyltransferase
MPVFFVPPEFVTPPTISITGDLLSHLRDSLRVTVGEIALFGDGARHRYRTEITDVSKRAITGRILETIQVSPRQTPRLILGQSLLKGEKMDWVIQKATELGVDRIVPVHTRHGVVKIQPERMEHQKARWERIALEAAQQSEQWRLPTIAPPQSLSALLTSRATGTVTLMLAERLEGTSLQKVALPEDMTGSVLILIGPEGGWSKEEVAMAQQVGIESITLGPQILRAETAALAAVSIVQSRLEALG